MDIYPTQKELLSLFIYHPDGYLIWKNKPCKNKLSGSKAGTYHKKGYKIICINYKRYLEHRLVWIFHNGTLPKNQIDHINQIKDDNRIENLRECSNAENHQNRPINKNNTSTVTGVGWNKNANKWRASIKVNWKEIHLGFFDSKEDAVKARKEAEEKYFPFAT